MADYEIGKEEFERVSFSRLALSPTSKTEYGESMMSGEALKRRFDEPFKLFAEKFNRLVSLIGGTADGDALVKHIPTGISPSHTLHDLLCDVVSSSGEFASYLSVGDKTLLEALAEADRRFISAEALCDERYTSALREADEKFTSLEALCDERYISALKDAAALVDGLRGDIESSYVKKKYTSNYTAVYITGAEGEAQATVQLAKFANPQSIARRGSDGSLKAAVPKEGDDVMTLGYAKANFLSLSEFEERLGIFGSRLGALEFAADGNLYTDEVRSVFGTGYEFPAGTLFYGSLTGFGGGNYREGDGGLLVPVPIYGVSVKYDGGERLYEIPSYITSLPGYGYGFFDGGNWVSNFIDLTQGRYVRHIFTRSYEDGDEDKGGCITDGTVTWYYDAVGEVYDVSGSVGDDDFILELGSGAVMTLLGEGGSVIGGDVDLEISYQLKKEAV